MTLWFISDTHFGHQGIIRFLDDDGKVIRTRPDGTPFASIEEHDTLIIDKWRAVVRPTDHVYHLGDVCFNYQHFKRIMPALTGKLRLVRGNHDGFKTKQYMQFFEEIHACRYIDGLMFTHIPVHMSSLDRWKMNVHGHTHGQPNISPKHMNICPEQIGFRPWSLEEIRQHAAR